MEFERTAMILKKAGEIQGYEWIIKRLRTRIEVLRREIAELQDNSLEAYESERNVR